MMNENSLQCRKTVHFVSRSTLPGAQLRCTMCGESFGPTELLRQVVLCYNTRDWTNTYRNNPLYRRCIDNITKRDSSGLPVCDVPTQPGYYWAEWRIQDIDGEELMRPKERNSHLKTSTVPEIVRVDYIDNELMAEVFGVKRKQPIENFLWRSKKLNVNDGQIRYFDEFDD